ncbi:MULTISPECIES: hypothetical protein [Brucella/Ochrobactrum group]|nr:MULTISPECIES: hypothetical protein [Brucella/Ochrobactrum group]
MEFQEKVMAENRMIFRKVFRCGTDVPFSLNPEKPAVQSIASENY